MSTDGHNWTPLPRNYEQERTQIRVHFDEAKSHPLTKVVVKDVKIADVSNVMSDSKTENPEEPLDPLRAGGVSSNGFVDPLSMAKDIDPLSFKDPEVSTQSVATAAATPSEILEKDSKNVVEAIDKYQGVVPDFEFWSDKCPRILSKYTTSASIALDNSFLNDGDIDTSVATAKVVDQAQSRVEEFESATANTLQAKSYLSQRDYITYIDDQHKKLISAWNAGERVVALRIAIQCAKLLGDMSVPTFYPSMFVVLTRILDTFGDLVFERIKSRGIESYDPVTKQVVYSSLPSNFKASDVAASAKETCCNWFYKTICIRELVPRFYIDLALIKCYRFLEDDSFSKNLNRLGKTIRGFGDPLAAIYARAYLTSKALSLTYTYMDNPPAVHLRTIISPTYRQAILECFDDQTFIYKSVRSEDFDMVSHIKNQIISIEDYIDLFSPAFEWIIQNVAYRGSEELFLAVIEQYKEYTNTSMVLQHIITCFPKPIVSKHALMLIQLIKTTEVNKHSNLSVLYRALGNVCNEEAPAAEDRLNILNDIWKVVTKIEDLNDYISVAEIFVRYITKYFTTRELNIFLKDVVKHLKNNDEYIKNNQTRIQTIIVNIFENTKDIDRVLLMENILPIIDLLSKESKIQVGKVILHAWNKANIYTNDTIIINTLFDIAKSLHDSITALSYESELKEVTDILINFILSIDFQKDLEQQLNIYVDFRAAFTNIDPVIVTLVDQTILLCSKAHELVKGRHSKKTSVFIKAALAYCHITIPSLDDWMVKLQLYQNATTVALFNNMIIQCEGFVKAYISLLADIPSTYTVYTNVRQSAPVVYNSICAMLNTLLYVPGHPNHGPFYLAIGILNTMEKYEPWEANYTMKNQLYLQYIRLFATYQQNMYPFTLYRVDSNNTLYNTNDTEYKTEISSMIDKFVTLLCNDIERIGNNDIVGRKTQGMLIIDVINTLVSSLTMDRHTATLVYKLFQSLDACRDAVEKKFIDSAYDHVACGKTKMYRELCKKLRQDCGFNYKEVAVAEEAN